MSTASAEGGGRCRSHRLFASPKLFHEEVSHDILWLPNPNSRTFGGSQAQMIRTPGLNLTHYQTWTP